MSKKISRDRLEKAARAYLLEWGYEYNGSILDCAESTDPDVYNPRCAKAVEAARKILLAAA
ncbi:hypothetical protein [Bradyrhizobium sp. Tv2a-2]|uniref:hypothetical protein n=1 Tax=Bradyrhizobium sp. Tv2a-2 TaxID=113395 RepID=UPI0004101763|nr:hypothetical protein [Bradyrhizobium sp. Tv2a-2]